MAKTTYTKKLGLKICSEISLGQSLRTVCSTFDWTPNIGTVLSWVTKYEEFGKQYARACKERAEFRVDEITALEDELIEKLEACDGSEDNIDPKLANAFVQAYKIKIENCKWAASKLLPKYKDKQQVDIKNIGTTMIPSEIPKGSPTGLDDEEKT